MLAGHPTVPAAKAVEFHGTFGPTEANFLWGETVVKQSVSGVCLNRSTKAGAGWGVKIAGETWTMAVTLDLA